MAGVKTTKIHILDAYAVGLCGEQPEEVEVGFLETCTECLDVYSRNRQAERNDKFLEVDRNEYMFRREVLPHELDRPK